MKPLVLTALASAAHIMLFMVADEYSLISDSANFLLFWAMLGLTFGAGIVGEAIK